MAVQHYENFPVASFLLPTRFRPAVHALYTFARNADDIADEGDASDEHRIASLDAFAAQLEKIDRHQHPENVEFQLLQKIVVQFQLPTQPLYQLLSAFKQDVIQKRYSTYAGLLDYCRRSANPVGTLILHLYGANDPQNLQDSDAICSALQLINFWQDIAVDWQKNRIYIPSEDMQRFGVSEHTIAQQIAGPAFIALMHFEIRRTRALMLSRQPVSLPLAGTNRLRITRGCSGWITDFRKN